MDDASYRLLRSSPLGTTEPGQPAVDERLPDRVSDRVAPVGDGHRRAGEQQQDDQPAVVEPEKRTVQVAPRSSDCRSPRSVTHAYNV